MSEYTVEIEGKWNLQEITELISDEELSPVEFVSSSISFQEGRITNIATFKKLKRGTFANKLTLVKHGEAQPDGTVEVWSGVMIVAGTNEAVSAYRAT